ncbi:FAD-binding protein [Rhizobium sp. CRIBSB]|nr:FAD-binding protein [Rhizobium sp. CRIBSB]
MIHDLGKVETGTQRLTADVLVIGGGTVGLVLADKLARAGRRVIVLESGEERQDTEEHPLNAVEQEAALYAGAAHGRFRCLGGTSTRWGGAMLPFQPADLEGPQDVWPLSLDALIAYRAELETTFDLPQTPYEVSEPTVPDHIARLAKWPPFEKRNVATLLGPRIRSAEGPEIWLNATAVSFAMRPDGRLGTIEARSPNGRVLQVDAPEVVVAAGAIESTRILLLIDRQHDQRVFTPDDVLGRYFHDHLSACVARLSVHDRSRLNRMAGFRFEGAAMRNLRFELANDTPLRKTLPASFAHIAFRDRPGGGFDALRDIFRNLQQRRLPGGGDVMRLALALPWLARAVWWRGVEKRLLYPAHAEIELHMVIEQAARATNRITLGKTLDRHEQPLASIHWRVDADDKAALRASVDAFEACWKASPMRDLADIVRRPHVEAEDELETGGGIFHPGGSTRMGRTAKDGVVDTDLRTFRVPNLTVVSTSTFPTGGGANPTMMLLLSGLRAADRLGLAK